MNSDGVKVDISVKVNGKDCGCGPCDPAAAATGAAVVPTIVFPGHRPKAKLDLFTGLRFICAKTLAMKDPDGVDTYYAKAKIVNIADPVSLESAGGGALQAEPDANGVIIWPKLTVSADTDLVQCIVIHHFKSGGGAFAVESRRFKVELNAKTDCDP